MDEKYIHILIDYGFKYHTYRIVSIEQTSTWSTVNIQHQLQTAKFNEGLLLVVAAFIN